MMDEEGVQPMRASAAQLGRMLAGAVLLRARLDDRTPHDVISDGFSAIIAWANEQLVHYDTTLDPDRVETLASLAKLSLDLTRALVPTFSSPDCLGVYKSLWPQLERPMPAQGLFCLKAVNITICIWGDGTISPMLTELLPGSPREGFSPGELGVELQLAAQHTWDAVLRDDWRRLHDEMGTPFNRGLSSATLESCLLNETVLGQFPAEVRNNYGMLLGFLTQIAKCLIIESETRLQSSFPDPGGPSLRLLSDDTGDGSGWA